MNSRQKGARCERLWRDVLRSEGYEAIRGCQNAGRMAGGQEAPDVITNLPYHFEVKFVEKLNIHDAMKQAENDCNGQPAVVAHKRSRSPWLVTMDASTFFKILRGINPDDKEKEKT